MTKIQIDQFGGYDAAAFLEYLKMESSLVVDVVLPKLTDAASNKHNVLYEYYIGCHAGQVLKRLSSDILFGIPPVEQKSPFNFILIEPRLEELAVFLERAAAGYSEPCELDHFYDWVTDQTDIMAPGEELVCWVLIQVSVEYFGTAD